MVLFLFTERSLVPRWDATRVCQVHLQQNQYHIKVSYIDFVKKLFFVGSKYTFVLIKQQVSNVGRLHGTT